MKKYIGAIKSAPRSITISVALSLFFIALSVQAATTISTNISTDGNLTVSGTSAHTGLATFGNASTTQLGSTGSAYFATSGGNVGIGSTSPQSILSIVGQASVSPFIIASSTDSSHPYFDILSDGRIGIGINNPWGADLGIWDVNNDGYTEIRLANDSDLVGNHLEFYRHTGVNYIQGNQEAGGPMYLYIGGRIDDNISASQIYLNGLANTVGDVGTYFTKGDGTSNAQGRIAGNGDSYLNVLSGNVGIGTTVPGAKLDINPISGYTGILFRVASSTLAAGNGLTVDTNGNVGIGTTVPSVKLHIVPGQNVEGIRVSGSDKTLGLSLAYTGAGSTVASIYNSYGSSATSRIDLGFGGTFGSGVVISFLQNGKVGIGTTTPSQKLDVNGSINIEGSANGIIMHDTATASCYLVQVTNGALALTAHACQ